MTLQLKIQLRASSVLFILFALSGVYVDWLGNYLAHQAYISLNPFSMYPILSALSGLPALLGFLGLIGQSRHQRHFFGWIGIGLTLCGVTLSHLALFVVELVTTAQPESNEITGGTLFTYGSLAMTLGLFLWAIDLPNTTLTLRLQKGAMVILGFFPMIPLVPAQILGNFNLPIIATILLIDPLSLLVINDTLSVVGWVLLAICVWFYQESATVPLSPVIPMLNTNFDLNVSPIPPTER